MIIVLIFFKEINNDIKVIIHNVDLQVVNYIPHKLDGLLRNGKDPLTKAKNTCVVHNINCKHCNKLYIVGQNSN